ncbi:MAG: ATP-binding protein [Planktomarina temperata]|nr:ATP-binding protein [Planktomarina temperata]
MAQSDEAAQGKITFTRTVAEDLQLWADPEQLYRVISNLCRNARQALEATPGQGQIDLSAAEAQGHWWIKVQDNGPGLPERPSEGDRTSATTCPWVLASHTPLGTHLHSGAAYALFAAVMIYPKNPRSC